MAIKQKKNEHDEDGGSAHLKVWLNGRMVDADEARVSIFDAGIQHGVGLFETISVRCGRIYRLDDHLKRLEQSAKGLRLADVLRTGLLGEAVAVAVEESGLSEARVRLTLTGGDLNLLSNLRQRKHAGEGVVEGEEEGEGEEDRSISPTIFVVVQPATVYPEAFFACGVRVLVADGRLNPFDVTAGHKTLNYWSRLRALQDAAGKGCGEAIWLSVSNHVMSGSVSNLFAVMKGGKELVTPIAHGEELEGGLPMPVLPGITRKRVIFFAEASGMEVTARMMDISDVLGAAEVFLTNSSWGILPVVAVEGKAIGASGDGGGVVGEVTQVMRARWFEDGAG